MRHQFRFDSIDVTEIKTIRTNRSYPPHSMEGLAVPKASDEVKGGVCSIFQQPGILESILRLSELTKRDRRTAHGKEHQQHLADMAIQHPQFQAEAKLAQTSKQRVILTLTIKDLLNRNLA